MKLGICVQAFLKLSKASVRHLHTLHAVIFQKDKGEFEPNI